MTRLHVAIVCPDEKKRLEAAKAFDGAPPEWKITMQDVAPSAADVIVTVDGPEGDVRFDPARPQDVLAEVARAGAPPSVTVAVVGSSGGCGATSVALHLASALEGRVCYLDATVGRGASLRLGLEVDEEVDPGDVDAVPTCGGFGYLAAPRTGLPGLLARLDDRLDARVIDLPAHRLDEVAQGITAAVLVMAPTVPSARSAAATLERHGELSWAVVSNRLGPGGESQHSELARIVGRRIGLRLPCSPGLRDAEDDDRLLTSAWSPWRRGIGKLARAVL